MTRKDKKSDKCRRLQMLRNRHWERCAKALDVLGLGDGFRTLRNRNKEMFSALCRPLPEIDATPLDNLARKVEEEILQELANESLLLANQVVSWVEAYRFICPLVTAIANAFANHNHIRDPDEGFLRKAQLVCAEHAENVVHGTLDVFMNTLHRAVNNISDLELRLCWFQINSKITGRNPREHRVTICTQSPQRTDVILNGASRPVYRCGGDCCGEGFRWVSWTGESIGSDAPPGGYPVYIQKHALLRLYERLKPLDHATIHSSMLRSLGNPILTLGRPKDFYLVEFKLAGRARVGYLVVRRAGEMFVVTTFLFLTMQGTPEAERLAASLRLRRADIEYNDLDTLSKFINTDIAQDEELTRAFTESGCLDLLHITWEDSTDTPIQSTSIRSYLGLAAENRLVTSPLDETR